MLAATLNIIPLRAVVETYRGMLIPRMKIMNFVLSYRSVLYAISGLAWIGQAIWIKVAPSSDIISGLGDLFVTGERQAAIMMFIVGVYAIFSAFRYQRYAKFVLSFGFMSWSMSAIVA